VLWFYSAMFYSPGAMSYPK